MTEASSETPSAASRPLRAVRIAAWAAVVVLVIVAGGLFLWRSEDGSPGIAAATIGGPFQLVDQRGAIVTEAALKGHPSALFFGYTYCPDVCPTTLYEMTVWLGKLGADGDKLKAYFVTVDPERDTKEQIAAYLEGFDPRITGLTGSREAIDAMLKSYRVYSRKAPSEDGEYIMDHTAAVYLLDKEATFTGTVDYKEDEATALAKLKRLVAGT
jgi:protein SCO1/2